MKTNLEIGQDYIYEYEKKAAHYRKWQQRYNVIWYAIGYPQIVLSSVMTYLTSPNDFGASTAIGIITLLLSVSLVFFDIRAKIEKFRDTKQQYLDLAQDIEAAMLRKNEEIMLATLDEVIEKEKFVMAYAISPSECFEQCK